MDEGHCIKAMLSIDATFSDNINSCMNRDIAWFIDQKLTSAVKFRLAAGFARTKAIQSS